MVDGHYRTLHKFLVTPVLFFLGWRLLTKQVEHLHTVNRGFLHAVYEHLLLMRGQRSLNGNSPVEVNLFLLLLLSLLQIHNLLHLLSAAHHALFVL